MEYSTCHYSWKGDESAVAADDATAEAGELRSPHHPSPSVRPCSSRETPGSQDSTASRPETHPSPLESLHSAFRAAVHPLDASVWVGRDTHVPFSVRRISHSDSFLVPFRLPWPCERRQMRSGPSRPVCCCYCWLCGAKIASLPWNRCCCRILQQSRWNTCPMVRVGCIGPCRTVEGGLLHSLILLADNRHLDQGRDLVLALVLIQGPMTNRTMEDAGDHVDNWDLGLGLDRPRNE